LKLAGEMLNPDCTPVPLNAIVRGDPLALLTIVTLPVALPVAVGANTTFRVAVATGFNVNGVVTPFTVNPVPLAPTFVIWTAAVPVLVKVMCCVALLPVLTFPKLSVVEFAWSCPVAAADPVPLSVTVMVGFVVSLLVIAKLPVTAPAVVG